MCECIYPKCIAGILDLSKTYGKESKFLYLCKPDDSTLPFFLIPYNIPVTFMKNIKQLYITFQYTHSKNEMLYGSMIQNLGCVNDPNHFYEYMMYCKSLNVSIQPFTKIVINQLKKIIPNLIPIRKDNIFTIDKPGSIDLDDAISISGNIISIYIANVPIIIDQLQLWDSFTDRISNIYLPDKKRIMVPSILAQLCSLNENEIRNVIVMDINMETLDYAITLTSIRVTKNYTYETIDTHADYQKIKNWLNCDLPSEVISKLMIIFNTNCATSMKKYKNGIYKKVQHQIDFLKNQTSLYEPYNEMADYIHITSPIRRLVDILNAYKLSMNENLYAFTENAEIFYKKWLNKLDYINSSFKNIRKVQSKCKILSIFEKEKHRLFKGTVYDKIERNNKYYYQVYIEELRINCNLSIHDELIECQDYMFKLYVFHDEAQLKRKIKIQLNN